MAIIAVQETFTNRGSSFNDKRQRDYTRSFDVLSNLRDESQAVVRLASGIPRPWTPYITPQGDIDPGSYCTNVEVKQDTQDPFLWRAVAQYSSLITRPDIHSIENPLLRPWEVSWSSTNIMIPASRDREGNWVINSAGELFDPPPEEEEYRLVLTVTRNEVYFDPNTIRKYKGKVNSQPWIGIAKGQARMVDLSSTKKFEGGFWFWPTTYIWHIREPRPGFKPEEAWALNLLDRGFYELDDSLPPKLKIATDVLGRPVTQPVLLDGSGHKLAKDADPVYLTFHIHGQADFNDLFPSSGMR